MTSHSLFTAIFTLSLIVSGLYLTLSEPDEIPQFLTTIAASIIILSAVLYVTRDSWRNARFSE